MDQKPHKTGQASAESVEITRDVFIDAVSSELIDYFYGTSVQGLVELEARSIAALSWARALDACDQG